jgi:hypothetical protein
MATTNSLEQQILDSQSRLAEYKKNQNKYAVDAAAWAKQSAECQAARDEKSTGIAKNNACHIDTLSNYNKMWDEASKQRDYWASKVSEEEKLLVQLQEEAKKNVAQALAAYQSTPEYIKSQQQAVENEKERKAKQKVVIIFFVTVVVIVLGVVIIKRIS